MISINLKKHTDKALVVTADEHFSCIEDGIVKTRENGLIQELTTIFLYHLSFET